MLNAVIFVSFRSKHNTAIVKHCQNVQSLIILIQMIKNFYHITILMHIIYDISYYHEILHCHSIYKCITSENIQNWPIYFEPRSKSACYPRAGLLSTPHILDWNIERVLPERRNSTSFDIPLTVFVHHFP